MADPKRLQRRRRMTENGAGDRRNEWRPGESARVTDEYASMDSQRLVRRRPERAVEDSE